MCKRRGVIQQLHHVFPLIFRDFARAESQAKIRVEVLDGTDPLPLLPSFEKLFTAHRPIQRPGNFGKQRSHDRLHRRAIALGKLGEPGGVKFAQSDPSLPLGVAVADEQIAERSNGLDGLRRKRHQTTDSQHVREIDLARQRGIRESHHVQQPCAGPRRAQEVLDASFE